MMLVRHFPFAVGTPQAEREAAMCVATANREEPMSVGDIVTGNNLNVTEPEAVRPAAL